MDAQAQLRRVETNAIDQIFKDARTHSAWLDQGVDSKVLHDLYDLTKLCPTSANCNPLRVVFVKSKEAKEKLKGCLLAQNVEKTMTAPVTAILGYDMQFYEHLPFLFPFVDAKAWFEGNDSFIYDTAFRNSSMQGGYFILAARALGLDCGPMSGFNNAAVDAAFFPEGNIKSNFLCNLGYGDHSKLPGPRAPRFDFQDVCDIV